MYEAYNVLIYAPGTSTVDEEFFFPGFVKNALHKKPQVVFPEPSGTFHFTRSFEGARLP